MPVAISNLSSLWTNSANTYNALCLNVTTVAYEANSKLFNLKANGSERFTVDTSGRLLSNATPVVRIHTSNTEPNSAFVGDEWHRANTGGLYKYIEEGGNTSWVLFGGRGGASAGNLDGGAPDSDYGGISILDAGAIV
jgi:hypothetical protein